MDASPADKVRMFPWKGPDMPRNLGFISPTPSADGLAHSGRFVHDRLKINCWDSPINRRVSKSGEIRESGHGAR